MHDLFPEPVPAEAVFSPRLRVEAVTSDNMEPTLSKRDFVLISPTDRFLFDGVYLISDGIGTTIVRAQTVGNGEILFFVDNPLYSTRTRVPRAQFNEIVLGFVVADVKVRAPCLLQEAMRDVS